MNTLQAETEAPILVGVLACLESMDIEGGAPEKLLGDELGMDSQELLSLALLLEKRFRVKVLSCELRRNMSVFDMSVILAKKIALGSQDVTLQHGLAEDVVIKAPLHDVYRALFEFQSWPNRLPHVLGVVKRYDDGMFQEFEMEVEGSNGAVMSIRSVRRCDQGEIRFFQPTPPKFMRHHCGGWILNPLDEQLTHLLTWHQWRLSELASTVFPDQADKTSADQIQHWLTEHARLALHRWKTYFEERDGHEKNGYG